MTDQGTMEREILSCCICLDLLQDPKTLPCLHRFCEGCIDGHIIASTARTADLRPGFSCPECRAFIPAPDSSSTPSTWAGQLKTDFMVKSLVEVYQSKQVAYAPKVRHPCPKHEDKEQELYCFDCSTTVCHLCAVISHRACRKIGTVTEAAQQRRAMWQEYIQQIPGLINDALDSDNLKERYWKEINKNKACVEKAIKEAAKKMHSIVAVEEAQLLRQVQSNYDNLRNKALTSNDQIKKLKSFDMNVSSTLSSSSDFDLMVEKDVSLTIDSCSRQNQVANRDYRRSCEALSSVRWSFQPQSVYRVNLGRVVFSG